MDFSSNDNSGDSINRNHGRPPSRIGFNQNSSIDNNRNGNGNANHNRANNSSFNVSFKEVSKQMKDFKKYFERWESRMESRINNLNSRMDSFMYIIFLMGVVIIINNCQLVYIIINK